MKYHIKYFKNLKAKGNQDLTLLVLTLFNKRAFSISDSFTDAIILYSQTINDIVDPSRLDTLMHNSLGENCTFQFLGVICEFELSFTPEGWFFVRDESPPGLLKYQDQDSGTIVMKVYVTLLRKDSGWRIPKKINNNLGCGSVFKEGVLAYV